MTFWLLAAALCALVLVTLWLSARQGARVARPDDGQGGERALFRARLKDIETDLDMGRMGEAEAESARAELAREVMRLEDTSHVSHHPAGRKQWAVMGLTVLLVPVLAFWVYSELGRPELPSLPLAARPEAQIGNLSFEEAISRVEARMQQDPSDVRGWQVLGPAYMQLERFGDAVNAFGRINALSEPTAATLTDEAEARIMFNNGHFDTDISSLLDRAHTLDPKDVRTLYYIAGGATAAEQWDKAETAWTELLALSDGTEAWRPAAERGLLLAQNKGELPADAAPPAAPANGGNLDLSPEQRDMVQGMVEGLADRLYSDGGTVEEWTRLVRSRLVLGDLETAKLDYEKAIAAHPDPAARQELDQLASGAGLTEAAAQPDTGTQQ
ncbi:MAG: c-type cytochrome biogenesis protein CcmI [Hyphomicrobiaceae bacterium]|nr:c-type cytochrome biogenesis protein CcmI [Hyphomicrobiaceae bacterium]